MITYDEINNMDFQKSAFGGYKADDVDDFVEEAASTIKELTDRIAELNVKITELEKSLAEYKQTEASLHTALVIAQETSSRLIKESTDKAESVLKEAQEKAKIILDSATAEAKAVSDKAGGESSELMKKTKERASEILREALVKASGITKKAKEKSTAEEEKYIELKEKVREFRSNMLNIYKSHVELINEMKPGSDDDQTDAKPKAAEESVNKEEKTEEVPEIKEAQEVQQAKDAAPDTLSETAAEISSVTTDTFISSNNAQSDEKAEITDDSIQTDENAEEKNVSEDKSIEDFDLQITDEPEEIDLDKINFDSFSDMEESEDTYDFGITE